MFTVTYEIITPESAELGGADESGIISDSVSLHRALHDVFETRTAHCEGITHIDPSDSDIGQARWITIVNGMEYQTGAYESRSIHLPDNMTASSRKRLLRYMNNDAIFA